MSETKSYVKYLKKQGVGGGTGFELEIQIAKGDTKEEIVELGKAVLKTSKEIIEFGLKENL